ncbi:MAG: hypothetical protein LBR37_00855, partial [Erysipelotrichaceae bacterium]|nr:hypothetical protein [Erysipelotrichaceae bacterium]
MKNFKNLKRVFAVVPIFFALIGCGPDEPPPPVTHTVTFDKNYETPDRYVEVTVSSGDTIFGISVSRDGFDLKAWQLEGQNFVFETTPITRDITLVALWEAKEDNRLEVTTTKVVTYAVPDIFVTSPLVTAMVENEELFVYNVKTNYLRQFTWSIQREDTPVALFDFAGQVDISLTVNNDSPISNVSVSPMIFGINPTVTGNKIAFTIDQPVTYTIQYTLSGARKAFHLITNPLETEAEKIDPNNIPEDVIYVGPGIYHSWAIPTASNKTIYLAGGAYVYGQIRAELVDNLIIRGRGIIAGEIFNRTAEAEFYLPVEIKSSSHITIDGISIFDPAGWAVTLYNCTNVTVNNIKIITSRPNGDGISVQGCRDVNIKGGFVRTWDDSIVIKDNDDHNTENVDVGGVSVWTDLAQSLEIGFETRGEYLRNVTFHDIVIINNFHKPAMSIHLCDIADVSQIRFQNITLENGMMLGDRMNDQTEDSDPNNNFFIDLNIAFNADWSSPDSQGNLGTINGVFFDNIKVMKIDSSIRTRLGGDSNTSRVRNVNFSNIDYAGAAVNKAEDLKLFLGNDYADAPNFLGTTLSAVSGASLESFKIYENVLEDDEVAVTQVAVPYQSGLIVPDFAYLQGDLPFSGMPISTGVESVNVTHGAGTMSSSPYDDGSGDYADPLYPGVNAFDGDKNTMFKSLAWKDEASEFSALTIEFDDLRTIGTIRIFLDSNNVYSQKFVIQVNGRFSQGGTVGTNYTRVLPLATYESSPKTGNSIDINFTVHDYKAIQLRIFRIDGLTGAAAIQPVFSQGVASINEIEFYGPSY